MSVSLPSSEAPVRSSLETKETLLHFSKTKNEQDPPKNLHYRGFIQALYYQANYSVSNALQASPYASHIEVNKAVRNLRFCCTMSLVEVGETNSVVAGSFKCRNKFCHICNRARAMKYGSRLKLLLETEFLNQDYKFYFVTITMNSRNRKDDYLKELKSKQAKLIRSKVWSNIFGEKKEVGMICSYENVIKKNRYHIHSHNLVMCKGLKMGAKKAHGLIRDKWMKLTGDSYIVHLKLLSSDDYVKSIAELFKYSTKLGNLNKFTSKQVEMLSKWVISSKGMNFTNARGLLRGHELTSCKSKLDDNDRESIFNSMNDYLLAKTNSLRFNRSTTRQYSPDDRKEIKENVKLVDIRNYILLDTVYDSDDLHYLMKIAAKEGLKAVEVIMEERAKDNERERVKDNLGFDHIDKNVSEIVIDEKSVKMELEVKSREAMNKVRSYKIDDF